MPAPTPAVATPAEPRPLLAGYAGLCALCWALYAMAGTEWQRGAWRLWDGIYEASWNLGPPMAIGLLALPWVRRLQNRPAPWALRLAAHGLGAATLVLLWLGIEYTMSRVLFGVDHAQATFEQHVLWRAVWGVFVYLALMAGFGGALHARRARAAALAAAQAEAALARAAQAEAALVAREAQAKAALVRAELAAISGKLNPHFLFNTLNSLLLLTRKDAGAAEAALQRFARMMRHVLDGNRAPGDRVALRDEIEFVRDYLALESLRLGPRLRVQWQVDDAVLDEPLPPLTLQPLVENAVLHGVAPQLGGALLHIEAQRRDSSLRLVVRDDGAGCVWPPAGPAEPTVQAKPAELAVPVEPAKLAVPAVPARSTGGVGLSALRRRFEIDYEGRARLQVRSAPGQGFEVELLIPLDAG